MALLTFSNIKEDLLRMAGSKGNSANSTINTAVTTAIIRASEEFVQYGDGWGFVEELTDRVYIPLQAPYTTGTVTVTQDSKTVTGSGTTFTKDMEGSFLVLDNEESYEIRTHVSATSLTLAIPYQSTTASGATYSIYKRFYPLPLNFDIPLSKEAKITTPGLSGEAPLMYNKGASFSDQLTTGKPSWFAIRGNTRTNDYYNTGTITVATSGTTSTWTVSTGTLPTDIVDREVRIVGESRSYYINTRASGTTFTTYDVYVNPNTQTNTQATASTYAITPKETPLIGFSTVADQRYVVSIPYVKKLDEMLLDTDISPIVFAGYGSAFLALCRFKLAEDARAAMRGDMVAMLTKSADSAMAAAWLNECQKENENREASAPTVPKYQQGASWL